MEEKLLKITFEPRRIIEYIKKKGSITSKDLEVDFGYSNFDALRVISELDRRGIIIQGDYEYIKEKRAVRRLWHLTEKGEKIEELPERIEMIGKKFPLISKAGMEIMNYVLESTEIAGIDSLEELIEMLESQSPKLIEIIKRAHVEVLKDFSPEELRQLTKEIKEIRKDLESQH